MSLHSILPIALGLIATTCGLAPSASEATADVSLAAPAAIERPQDDKPTKFDHSHAAWTKILASHVHGDRFDYASLQKSPQPLYDYIATLQAVTKQELDSWTEDEQMAFWINVYNAHVIKLIVKEYPVKSIRDLGTLFSKVWDKDFIRLDRLHPSGKKKKLTLNDVEHKILRPKFKDARVHAAVNCASESCPPLMASAFTAEKLDEQLDAAVRGWLADTTRNRFDKAKNEMRISEIFDWFKDDFKRDGGSVRAWIVKYAPSGTAEWLEGAKKVKTKYLDYSWKLNDFKKQ